MVNGTVGTIPMRDGAVHADDVQTVLHAQGYPVAVVTFTEGYWPGHVGFVAQGADGVPLRGTIVADFKFTDARADVIAKVRVDHVGEEAEDEADVSLPP